MRVKIPIESYCFYEFCDFQFGIKRILQTHLFCLWKPHKYWIFTPRILFGALLVPYFDFKGPFFTIYRIFERIQLAYFQNYGILYYRRMPPIDGVVP